ncbi:hypothetical protein [Pseudonocardia dioxanivorans]|uniref:hypothetical protein n=1 Tax=Pseudonocardia dioxanivorans TaxID=240495 RepID=UPI00131A5611|nr:hypothetical protein [Pseudonocardia dioxanivorans]
MPVIVFSKPTSTGGFDESAATAFTAGAEISDALDPLDAPPPLPQPASKTANAARATQFVLILMACHIPFLARRTETRPRD